jgi:predicted DNA-binding protein
MPQKFSKPRRIGRPPAGQRDGEKVKDYPQLSIRVPIEVKEKLQVLSLISAQPQWKLISDAIEIYFDQQPDSEKRLVKDLLRRSRSRNNGDKAER